MANMIYQKIEKMEGVECFARCPSCDNLLKFQTGGGVVQRCCLSGKWYSLIASPPCKFCEEIWVICHETKSDHLIFVEPDYYEKNVTDYCRID